MPLGEPPLLTSFFETRLNVDTYAISRSQSLATGISPIRVDEHTSNVNVISKRIHVNGFPIMTTDTTDCVQGKVSQRRSISTGKYRSREDEEPSAGSDNSRRHFHSIGGHRSPPSLSSTPRGLRTNLYVTVSHFNTSKTSNRTLFVCCRQTAFVKTSPFH
jgi:hypothetical protein